MPDDLVPQKNTGVILGQRPSDYVGGTLTYKVVVPNGDWRPFLVTEEKQYSQFADAMDCVSESLTNSLEIQCKQETGRELNFSARALAKLSGTTHNGNYLYKVADEARVGLLLEEEWPTPPSFTWNSFYAPIPNEVLTRRRKYGVAYEWVNKDLFAYHLKHAPLQIIITEQNPNHAVTLVAIEGNKAYYFDSYPPHLKTINLSNIYPSALKAIGTFNLMYPTKKVKINGSHGILVDTPNTTIITKAEDEAEWRSYSKADSYRMHTVNDDGTTDWSVDLEINFPSL